MGNSFCNFLVFLVFCICTLRDYKIQLRVKLGLLVFNIFCCKKYRRWFVCSKGGNFQKFSRVCYFKGSRSSASIASKSNLGNFSNKAAKLSAIVPSTKNEKLGKFLFSLARYAPRPMT